VTFNGHGRVTGDCISFTTDGALPTGLSVSTKYYVIYNDANSFWVATTLANALAGTKINTSSAGSGTHTLMYNPWGIADATHFNLPDFRGLVTVGAGQQGSADWASAEYKESFGQNRQDEFQAWQLGVTNNGGTHYSAGYNYNSLQNDTAGGSPGFTSIFNNTGFQGHAYPFIAYSDGTNGTPRKGKKTTPARAAVYKIIKVI
jgi:hypothetical protein